MDVGNALKIDLGPAKKISTACAVDLFSCFQCEKCTNGCPVTFAMDYYPHQIIRMLQLGLLEQVFASRSIWVCASCETCFTRCPHEIEIPRLMDHLKHQLMAQGKDPADPAEQKVAEFHKAFLGNIRTFGRVNETFLMGNYQLKVLKSELRKGKIDIPNILKNLKLGVKMLNRGKLSFIPRRVGTDAIRECFVKRPKR